MTGESLCYAVVFVSEAFIAWTYFERLFVRTKPLLHITVSFALLYSLLFVISRYFDVIAINTCSFFIANAILVYTNYSCSAKNAVLQSAVLAFIMSMAEILMALVLKQVVNDYAAYTYNFVAMISLAVTSKLLYFLCAEFLSLMLKPDRNDLQDPSFLALLVFLPVASFVIADSVIYIGMTVELTRPTEILMVVSVLLLLFVNIFTLIAYRHSQILNREYLELQIGQVKDKADAAYYEMLQSQYESQRVLIHDIKNHMLALDHLAQEGDTEGIIQYISEVEKLPGFKNKARLCANPVLNMVLLQYSEYCEEHGIEFIHDVRSTGAEVKDSTSVTALFGNLLSNAVEAAELSQEKYVELTISKNDAVGVIIVSVINSCDAPPIPDKKGGFLSRKKDPTKHGFGVKSINRVIQKYNGTARMWHDAATNKFQCIIQFPI